MSNYDHPSTGPPGDYAQTRGSPGGLAAEICFFKPQITHKRGNTRASNYSSGKTEYKICSGPLATSNRHHSTPASLIGSCPCPGQGGYTICQHQSEEVADRVFRPVALPVVLDSDEDDNDGDDDVHDDDTEEDDALVSIDINYLRPNTTPKKRG